MASFGVQRELVLLGHYFCTCWISRGAGQPGWNSFASWVHGDAIKKSLWLMRGVISLLHQPNKPPHSPPFLWFCLACEPQIKDLNYSQGKWIKDSFALILPLHNRSHFYDSKEPESCFLCPEESMATLIWLSKRKFAKVPLCSFISWRDFPLGQQMDNDRRLCWVYAFGCKFGVHLFKFNVAVQRFAARPLINQKWLRSWHVNLGTNAPWLTVCLINLFRWPMKNHVPFTYAWFSCNRLDISSFWTQTAKKGDFLPYLFFSKVAFPNYSTHIFCVETQRWY